VSVSSEDIREALAQLADQIEREQLGGRVVLKYTTTDGDEHEHVFPLETEEDRTATLLSIRKVLGQVH
jgi:hypothetical protein